MYRRMNRNFFSAKLTRAKNTYDICVSHYIANHYIANYKHICTHVDSLTATYACWFYIVKVFHVLISSIVLITIKRFAGRVRAITREIA